MSKVMINTPEWQKQAKRLFFAEFEEPKKFYEKYSAATDLYYELASRLVAHQVEIGALPEVTEPGMVAYRWMYDTYRTDVNERSINNLFDLILEYKGIHAASTEGVVQ